jgi:hypothetical protein
VEIAAADVTVYGGGSPDGGDTYSRSDLEKIAESSNAVCADLKPPVKIGHDKSQRLLRASGLWGEQPRSGTLRNFRVVGDKLVCDVKEMPRKLADLARSGAFRLRSMELGPARSQRTNTTYPSVVKALALLGATAPAFQTLDDIHATYAGDGRAETARLYLEDEAANFEEDPDLRVTEFAVGDVIWDDEDGVRDIMQDVSEALNGPNQNMPPRYWVADLQLMDVDGDGDVPGPRARVQEYGSGTSWIVPLTFQGGEPVVPPASEWTLAVQAWVEGDGGDAETTDMSESRGTDAAADTSRNMPVKPKPKEQPKRPDLDEAQVAFFAEKLGLKAEDGKEIDAGTVLDALDKQFEAEETESPNPTPPPPAPGEPPSEPGPDAPPAGVRTMSENEYTTLREMAERGSAAAEALRVKERRELVEGAVKEGKLDPAQVKSYEEKFDKDPEFVRQVIDDLPVRDELLKTYGSDETGERDFSDEEERQFAEYCAYQGIPYIPARRSAA